MTTTSSARRVVVGVDGSPAGSLALTWAVATARRDGRPLHLLRAFVVPVAYAGAAGFSVIDPLDAASLRADAEQQVADALATVRADGGELVVTTAVVEESPSAALVEASSSAALVVVGARGAGAVAAALLGSTSTQVAMHAHAPVVVVKAGPAGEPAGGPSEGAAGEPAGGPSEGAAGEHPGDPSASAADGELASAGEGRVVVGVDGSAGSTEGVRFALAQAAALGVGVDVVHVVPPGTEVQPADDQALTRSLAGCAGEQPAVDVRASVVAGHPARTLVARSAGAPLLVVGSRGRGGFASLVLGSVSHAVLQRATCPVAVVRVAG